MPLLLGVAGKAAQFQERGEYVEKLCGPTGPLRFAKTGRLYDQGHADSVFPDGSFCPTLLFSQMKAMVGKHGRAVAEEAVQLHGGMGVTEELSIGDYLKRLMVIDTLFGDSDWQRRRFAALRYGPQAA